jgi:diguanylate cyclase
MVEGDQLDEASGPYLPLLLQIDSAEDDVGAVIPRDSRVLDNPAELAAMPAKTERGTGFPAVKLELSGVIDMVLRCSEILTDAGGAMLEVIEHEELLVRDACGSVSASIGRRSLINSSFSGQCVRSGVVLLCEDTETDPRVDREWCRESGIRSLLVAPVSRGTEVVGVLTSASSQPASFNSRHIEALSLIAHLLESAVTGPRSDTDALRDSLTGLASRALVLDRIEHALKRMRRLPGPLSVFHVEVDGLQETYDRLGFGAGTELLGVLARRLRTALREADTIGRLSGGGFVAVLEHSGTEKDVRRIAYRVVDTLCQPVVLVEKKVTVLPRIGIAMTTDPKIAPTTMLEQAAETLSKPQPQSPGPIIVVEL